MKRILVILMVLFVNFGYSQEDTTYVNFGDSQNYQPNDIKTKEKKEKIYRKGFYLGFHLTPGIGEIFVYSSPTKNEGLPYLIELIDNHKFALNGGLDLSLYFNNNIGIKTGLSYLNLSVMYNGEYNGYIYTLERYGGSIYGGSISYIGIPIKLILSTGNMFRFHFEIGLNSYYSVSSTINYLIYPHFNLLSENLIGLNIILSQILNLNFGLFFNFSINQNDYMNNNIYKQQQMIGLQIGTTFKL